MAFSITFYDNIKYHRQDFINRDLDFFGNGVVALTDFPLTFPTTANMTATIGQGRAWVDGFRISNDVNPVTVNFLAADATNPRIDIIQLGHDDVNSTYKLMVKQGVAAASPVEPNADPGYVKLYAVNVAANATSINSSNIIDRRGLVPLNVSGTQINMAGSAGTSQNNTFASGYTQTFSGSVVTSGSVTMNQGFSSTVAQGTTPFTVTSKTKVANLNADQVDGYDFNQSLQTTDSPTFAALTVNGQLNSGPLIVGNYSSFFGTLNVQSTATATSTTNYGSNQLAFGNSTWNGTAAVTNWRVVSMDSNSTLNFKNISGTTVGSLDNNGNFSVSNQISANAPQGSAPFSVGSTTKVTNLNVDKVDGYDFNQSLQTTDNVSFAKVTSTGGIYSVKNTLDDGLGNATFAGTGAFTGAISEQGTTLASKYLGLHATADAATKLATSRTLSLTSDVTGSASFDGSANASITATLAAVGTSGTYTKVTTDSKGRVTSGTSLGSTDVTGALGFTPANKAGDTFTGNVTAPAFVSNVAQGTAPFTVTSTTKVPNLNVDKVDGFDFNQGVQTSDSPTFVGVNASTFTSTVANGTAPFTVTSTTQVNNLNAAMVNGYSFNQSVKTTDKPTFAGANLTSDMTIPDGGKISSIDALGSAGFGGILQMTSNSSDALAGYGIWQNYNMYYDGTKWIQPRGSLESFGFSVTGQRQFAWYHAPATNLNGSQATLTKIASMDGVGNFNAASFTGSTFISNVAQGTAPFTVTSTTKVTNLNADMVDGYNFNQSLQTTDSPTFAGLTIGSSTAATQSWVNSFGLGSNAEDITGTDLNTLDATGFYKGNNLTNGPASASTTLNYYIIHIKNSSSYYNQIAIKFDPSFTFMYSRQMNNGTWGSWIQIATTDVAQMHKITQDNGLSFSPVDVNGVSTTDFNALKTPGEYYFGSGMVTNGPVGASADAGVIRVRQSDGNVITQEVIYTGGNQLRSNVYVRSYFGINNAWGAWDRLSQVNADFTKSFSGNGWQKLPSGLIIQWGTNSNSNGTVGMTVTFPIAFPNALYSVVPSIYDSNVSGNVTTAWVTGRNTTSFYVRTTGNNTFNWIAVGY